MIARTSRPTHTRLWLYTAITAAHTALLTAYCTHLTAQLPPGLLP